MCMPTHLRMFHKRTTRPKTKNRVAQFNIYLSLTKKLINMYFKMGKIKKSMNFQIVDI